MTMTIDYSTDKRFRYLAVATVVGVYLLIVVGGIVRVTESGLGCPDWPLCHGNVIPPPDRTAWVEFTHRMVAAIGGLLMLATLAVAWRRYRRLIWVAGMALASIILLVVQVPLGALVVLVELEPLTVAVHLGMAFLIFSCLVVAMVAAHLPVPDPQLIRAALATGYVRLLLGTLVLFFGLLLTGAWVVGINAQLGCPDWPLCHGSLLPPLDQVRVGVQLLHRYTAAVVTLMVVAVVWQTFRRADLGRGMRFWAVVAAVLFAVEVTIGALVVLWYLPMIWRALHLAVASGAWAALAIMASFTVLRGEGMQLAGLLSPGMEK